MPERMGKMRSCLFFLRMEKLFIEIFQPLLNRSKKFMIVGFKVFERLNVSNERENFSTHL
jgi:hypothetical protein